ncbi:MAG: hypothetical protein GC160_10920 [Acidobacteria bacterium]|nr:hypothetical protein [Acidobacteriota bacterium]
MNDSLPDPPSNEDEKPPLWGRVGGRAADAGWTMSGAVLGCLLLGYLIGEGWDLNPAATVAGLFVGLVVGFYNLARVMGLL